MESQLSTGTHHGPGFDVPEQGLHLRRADDGAWIGVLDTTMGPVEVEIHDDHVPRGHRVGSIETVVSVPEQFVALTMGAATMMGTIRTQAGPVPFSRRIEK